jgi:hypothetical protein
VPATQKKNLRKTLGINETRIVKGSCRPIRTLPLNRDAFLGHILNIHIWIRFSTRAMQNDFSRGPVPCRPRLREEPTSDTPRTGFGHDSGGARVQLCHKLPKPSALAPEVRFFPPSPAAQTRHASPKSNAFGVLPGTAAHFTLYSGDECRSLPIHVLPDSPRSPFWEWLPLGTPSKRLLPRALDGRWSRASLLTILRWPDRYTSRESSGLKLSCAPTAASDRHGYWAATLYWWTPPRARLENGNFSLLKTRRSKLFK